MGSRSPSPGACEAMTDDATPPGLDPATLEKLRRGVPLRITAMGELQHDGQRIEHPGVRRAFRDGLDVTEDGEPIMRLGAQWCYVTVDDCMLRATAAEIRGDAVTLRLDDGRTVALDPTTLVEEPGAGLRCTAPSRHSGRPLSVRFTNAAQMTLAENIEPGADGAAVLRLGARTFRISPG